MRRAVVLAVVAASALSVRASQTGPRDQIFVCGEDHKLQQPIPLTWGNVVLAGDGRLFVPCPAISSVAPTNHTPDHRERREARIISEGLGESAQGGVAGKPLSVASLPLELRWRAVQAYIRAGDAVKEQLPLMLKVGETFIGVPDPLGMFMPPNVNVITPACNPVVFISHAPQKGTRRWQSGRLFFLAMDKETSIRTEAAYGIAVHLATKQLEEEVVEAAWLELKACVQREQSEPSAGVAGVLLQAIGASRYPTRLLDEVGAYLAEQSHLEPASRIFGAAKALESLTRQHPNHKWGDALKVRLRQLVLYGVRTLKGGGDAPIRRLALMALRNARDFDVPTLRAAVADADFQVRRLVAMSLNLSDPQQATLGETLANDFEFQVRYEFLAPLQRLANRTGLCAPMTKFFKDPFPAVVMRAMDLVPATCTDLEEILAIIDGHAERLNAGDSFKQWHLPSRALSALARLNPSRAKALLPTAVEHPVWQVRAAAATTAVTLEDAATAETLAKDVEPNVRTAALDALFRLKSPALPEAAIDALTTQRDYQLLRAAALNLRGVPEDLKLRATDALLSALAKLTAEETDTSRDTREAIIDRLVETMSAERSGDLVNYLADYDDTVVAAAARAFEKLVGTAPGDRSKRRRYPNQPLEGVLYAPPEKAMMTFDEGNVIINFLPGVAPVTVARVHALIQQGYYNEKTFHRVVPNFVVQGGSPGKNEYAGVSRFMRDEVGPQAAHAMGTVGISTRGRDTGDAQIFINLLDNPRLDMHYTVFAVLEPGSIEVVNRLLDGAVIRTFTIIK